MFVDDEHLVQELLKMHAHKIHHCKDERCVFLLHMQPDRSVPFNAYFIKYTLENVLSAFNTDTNRSVQWLLHQLQTYSYESEVLAGVVFPSKDALALVFPSTKYSGVIRT